MLDDFVPVLMEIALMGTASLLRVETLTEHVNKAVRSLTWKE